MTVGGRYNYAHIAIQNLNPPDDPADDKLTGTHEFYRFNPMVGLTYQLAQGLTAYGSYAEANRAPTAASWPGNGSSRTECYALARLVEARAFGENAPPSCPIRFTPPIRRARREATPGR